MPSALVACAYAHGLTMLRLFLPGPGLHGFDFLVDVLIIYFWRLLQPFSRFLNTAFKMPVTCGLHFTREQRSV